jgi:Bacterial SH3 domain
MKTFFLTTIVAFFLAFNSFAIGNYKTGDKLTVLAKSGLSLRSSAEATGKKKSSLPFGTVVTVLAEGLKINAHQVEEAKGYTIKGYWVKVKAGKEEGWLFDGYLSSLKVLPSNADAKGVSADRDMFDALYSQTSPRKGDRKYLKVESGESYEQLFEDGTKLVYSQYEGGASRVVTFKKGITQEEAYLWGVSSWWGRDEKAGSIKYNGSTKHLRVNGDDKNPKAMRIMPSGSQWQASFEIAD